MKRLTADEVAKAAAKFIRGMEDSGDIALDIEFFFYNEFENDDCTTLTSMDNQERVRKRVSKALQSLADVMEQKPMIKEGVKRNQRARVKQMLKEFPFHYDELDINIDEICEVLYGPPQRK